MAALYALGVNSPSRSRPVLQRCLRNVRVLRQPFRLSSERSLWNALLRLQHTEAITWWPTPPLTIDEREGETAARHLSQRSREQAGHGEDVEQDQLVADPQTVRNRFELVAIEAGREEARLTLLIGLVDGERRLDQDPAGLRPENARQAYDMPIGVDVVLVGLAERADTVLQHRAAVAEDQSRRQPAIKILARQDLVAALLGEEAEPLIEPCRIDQSAVFGEQIVNRGAIGPHRTAPSGSMPKSSA